MATVVVPEPDASFSRIALIYAIYLAAGVLTSVTTGLIFGGTVSHNVRAGLIFGLLVVMYLEGRRQGLRSRHDRPPPPPKTR